MKNGKVRENFMILIIIWGQPIIGANIKHFYGYPFQNWFADKII